MVLQRKPSSSSFFASSLLLSSNSFLRPYFKDEHGSTKCQQKRVNTVWCAKVHERLCGSCSCMNVSVSRVEANASAFIFQPLSLSLSLSFPLSFCFPLIYQVARLHARLRVHAFPRFHAHPPAPSNDAVFRFEGGTISLVKIYALRTSSRQVTLYQSEYCLV